MAVTSPSVSEETAVTSADTLPPKPPATEATTEEQPPSTAPSDDKENSAVPESEDAAAPPLPSEPTPSEPPLPSEDVPSGPPLPKEPAPSAASAATDDDDGWDCAWDANNQAWYFTNRFTGQTQWDNPRVQIEDKTSSSAAAAAIPPPLPAKPAGTGYNPAIHGDYDPNAWYAQGDNAEGEEDYDAEAAVAGAYSSDPYASTAAFNRFNGGFATGDEAGRHTDEAKSHRQMSAYFDVEAAANAHDGRSLKAERMNKRLSKAEVKAFKEKRRARKEEKRRAWLME